MGCRVGSVEARHLLQAYNWKGNTREGKSGVNKSYEKLEIKRTFTRQQF